MPQRPPQTGAANCLAKGFGRFSYALAWNDLPDLEPPSRPFVSGVLSPHEPRTTSRNLQTLGQATGFGSFPHAAGREDLPKPPDPRTSDRFRELSTRSGPRRPPETSGTSDRRQVSGAFYTPLP